MPSDVVTIKRALFTVSDKAGIAELAHALSKRGAEIVATGKTATVLQEAGVKVTPIEKITGTPEAFQGRMKTLSFQVCSGILYRRGDAKDEADLKSLSIPAIDCVVVNFYPFEKTAAEAGISREKLIEEIDIGGPTLVRAAAKNADHVLVLTDPKQYAGVIAELQSKGGVTAETRARCASQAWERIADYDQAIREKLGDSHAMSLRYGENPHQKAQAVFSKDSPVAWEEKLTAAELSYNNILDLSACYALLSDLQAIDSNCTGVVIIKHNNPCGVALVPKSVGSAQKVALARAWEGDPVSAFGGVVGFTDAIDDETAQWLSERFVDVVAAPGLASGSGALSKLTAKRKNLKAVKIRRFGETPPRMLASIPGGTLIQTPDWGFDSENFKTVTKTEFPVGKERLVRFGIAVTRSLKSNAVSLVREIPEAPGSMQLVGAGQGQPNRVEALQKLAIPRAQAVLSQVGGALWDCIFVSDAFFPFRDAVDAARAARIRWIVQPGGSIKDQESIDACNEHGMSMIFTGTRHFRH